VGFCRICIAAVREQGLPWRFALNFLRAIRSRKPAGLNAPILDGHLSAALCHMGNISYRLGSPHTSGETVEKLKSLKTNEHAAETLDRVISHLSDNSVHLEGKTEFRLGPQLQFDPQAEGSGPKSCAGRKRPTP